MPAARANRARSRAIRGEAVLLSTPVGARGALRTNAGRQASTLPIRRHWRVGETGPCHLTWSLPLTVADLFRLIASLFAALFAPAHLLARLGGLNARALGSVARILERMKRRGHALAYEGDDDATIAARIDRAAWIARDPLAALKHMVRGRRGLARLLFAMVAPTSFTPPRLPCAPLCAAAAASAPDDTS